MLYSLLRIPASIAIWFYCRRLRTNRPEFFKQKGPLLIASNHPNSFLDAIIFASLFKQPVYSLARGDVFKNKWMNHLFRSLNMFPVFRNSEGMENMEQNYTSFDACMDIFKKNGIVLIFSEGRCINEWHLRPLMKGTARLALSTWEQGVPLRVLPTGINYQDFRRFGKNIDFNFGNTFSQQDIDLAGGFGKSLMTFNEKLNKELKPLVYEIENGDTDQLKNRLLVQHSFFKKVILAIPAIAGFILHLPLYGFIKATAKKLGCNNGHYDSIAVGALFLIYPVYLLLLVLGMYFVLGYWTLFLLVAMPFMGWSYMQLKRQF